MPKKFFFPIAFKAFVLFVFLLLVTLLGSAFYIHIHSKENAQTMINQQFNQALNMAENHFDLLKQMNKILVHNLSTDHEFLQKMDQKKRESLEVLIADKQQDIQCDQLILLDAQARIVTQSGSVPFSGNSLENLEIVEKTFEQKKQFVSIVRQFDIFVLYASAPIILEKKQVGLLLMGFNMNHQMMHNIKKDTIMEFTIVGDRAVAATSFHKGENSLTALPLPYVDYLWLLKYPDKYYEATIAGELYYLIARPLKSLDRTSTASMMLAYPSAQMHQQESDLMDATIMAILISLLISMVILFIFAQRMRKIFKLMIIQTKKIGKGDYTQLLKFHTNDEFEHLASNFNAMTHALQEKSETIADYTNSLETKVEKRTQELNEQKQSLEQILNLHPSMILTIQNRDILYVNRAFLTFFSIDTLASKEELCAILKLDLGDKDPEFSIRELLESLLYSDDRVLSFEDTHGDSKVFEVEFITIDQDKAIELAVFNDVTRLSSEKDRLEDQATHDPLTGQYNRIKFNQEMQKSLYNADRYETLFSVVICDIDNFKSINDTYGHNVGDYALITLSQLFSKHIRATDLFARWGGEEFVILLNETVATDAENLANILRKALQEYTFDYFNHLTCSFGVTQYKADDSAATMIDRADKALYYSKKAGKNRVTVQ